ncbi:MAG: histidine kinase, partial [Nitriliruptorales bacterium]|nr:histidine kinase [Nitriliruptorales bacterium]
LLDVRTELIERVVDGLAADGLLPFSEGRSASPAAIARAVEHRLIGGEIVAVAIRDTDGAIVYGEPRESGMPATSFSDLPHVEQHRDGLLHFIVRVDDEHGRALGTFEAFQEAATFNEVLARVGRNLWLSIAAGLGTLGIAMGAFTLAQARALDRRRRHAERLLRDLLRVENEERRRIAGSLHDDIGQPLYRLLYGLEGCRARLEDDDEIGAEFERLVGLVREVDGTLRAELRHLHRSNLDALDLASALEAIAEDCHAECGLEVEVSVELDREPTSVVRSVLLRAVKEALVNVRKHAAASRVEIRARGDDRRVIIDVADDGRGPNSPKGLGLTTAAERLESLGGGLKLTRANRAGAVLSVWAPLDRSLIDENPAG